ncbi:MAG: PEGA domain-containing protein [Spirochaetales bacterium]|nr:PEGA domain-containing protein [Spirochaetales bacterium]
MTRKRTTSILILIITTLCVAVISCATLFVPVKDTVKVECNAPGVKIYLDGIYMGETPLNMEISRAPGHMIRVEAEGYSTKNIMLERSMNGWGVTGITSAVLGGLMLGVGLFDFEYLYYTGLPGLLLLTISGVDLFSDKIYDYPETVQILLQ